MNAVANVRVKDYIIKSIREQILSGSFPAGMRLAQEELAEGLGVSRIPVREALQILEEQGVVERLPSRHMVVAEITAQQLHQIFQTIGELQYHYSRFILESEAREEFLEAVSGWDGREELAFHRLFSVWLDNGYLSRPFNNMLDTYVEYACSLPDTGGQQTAGMKPGADGQQAVVMKLGESSRQTTNILTQIQAAYVRGEREHTRELLRQYYRLLEENVLAERTRHLCKA